MSRWVRCSYGKRAGFVGAKVTCYFGFSKELVFISILFIITTQKTPEPNSPGVLFIIEATRIIYLQLASSLSLLFSIWVFAP